MMSDGYMGIFVADDEQERHCTTCAYESEVDRAECNWCARCWNDSRYVERPGWRAKDAD